VSALNDSPISGGAFRSNSSKAPTCPMSTNVFQRHRRSSSSTADPSERRRDGHGGPSIRRLFDEMGARQVTELEAIVRRVMLRHDTQCVLRFHIQAQTCPRLGEERS
jgi:hypothetical protein